MSEVKCAIEGWQHGNEVNAMWVCQWLWKKLRPIVREVFKRTDAFRAEDAAAEAGEKGAKSMGHRAKNADHFVDEGFSAAFEELELMLDPKETFWTTPTNETKEVKKKGKDETETRHVFKGQMTGRLLTKSDAWQWQGEE